MAATREQHALHEHSFLQNTDTRLDEFIAQGREVLDNLVDQRNMLKGTQRRLLDAAHTLGLSRDVIGWIERRRCVSHGPRFVRSASLSGRTARRICIFSSRVLSLRFSVFTLSGGTLDEGVGGFTDCLCTICLGNNNAQTAATWPLAAGCCPRPAVP